MIGKSLANGFQYTKLKYKQYLQFKYTTYVSFMFLFIQFIYQSLFLFSLLKLVLFSKFNSFLPNLLSGEHHKVVCPPYSRNCQFPQKKNRKQNSCFAIPCNKKAVLITHYWQTLLVTGYSDFYQKSNFQQVHKFLVEVLSM